jgi:hypothetical protein
MAMTRAQWANTVALTEFESVMRDKADEKTWNYEQIYGEVGTTDETEVRGIVWAAFGLPHVREYGEDIQTEDMKELGFWTLTDAEIALGTDIDDKLLEDLRHMTEREFLNQMGEGFGESFKQAKCLYAALPLNRGFNSTTQPMWDSAAWFDSHTLATGATVDNDLPPATPGSFSAVWDMIDWLRVSQYTQKGLRKRGIPWRYVYYPTHEREVQKTFVQQYEPDTLYRNRNTLLDFNIGLTPCIELNNTNDHFLLGTRSKRYLKYRMRKGLESHWEFGRRNRTRSNFNHMRIMVGVIDWDDAVGIPSS